MHCHLCLHCQLGFVRIRVVRRVIVVAAFPILLLISVDDLEYIVVDDDDRRCHCSLSQDVRLPLADGQSEVAASRREAVHE